jgi:hypothetical protein
MTGGHGKGERGLADLARTQQRRPVNPSGADQLRHAAPFNHLAF